MNYSLAQLLEEQLPFLAAQWPEPETDSTDRPADSPASSFGLLHYRQLLDAVHKDDYTAWHDQLRREGAAWAVAGSEVGTLIAGAQGFMNAVRRAVLADRLAP
ncbi:MAG TPA: hypothetical protein VF276_12135, partial [Chloroflexia bacterium]